jgi:RimJ/RimL family protein N-acetyltransferase
VASGADADGALVLRQVTIRDLGVILGELDDFWGGERDMAFLHQALYVHEFGETSVLAERDGRILGYLLGFVGPDATGYVHAVAVRREARGEGLARRMYERFQAHAEHRDAVRLKAITAPENSGSRAFHEALGFSAESVEGYSPSSGARLVFTRALRDPQAGAAREIELGGGVIMRQLRLDDAEALHRAIEANGEHLGQWLPFPGQPFERTLSHVRRMVGAFEAGRGTSMVLLDGDRLVGAAGFVEPSAEHSSTQLGYWLAADAQGRGLMTRAVAALVDQAFGPWGFERVEIRVAAGNSRSRAVAERLGFREEGRLRAGHRVAGAVHEELIYGRLKDDPRPPGGDPHP